jgi:hypothetical protein
MCVKIYTFLLFLTEPGPTLQNYPESTRPILSFLGPKSISHRPRICLAGGSSGFLSMTGVDLHPTITGDDSGTSTVNGRPWLRLRAWRSER